MGCGVTFGALGFLVGFGGLGFLVGFGALGFLVGLGGLGFFVGLGAFAFFALASFSAAFFALACEEKTERAHVHLRKDHEEKQGEIQDNDSLLCRQKSFWLRVPNHRALSCEPE